MTSFNGHKNWNHWNVSLWIGNDEGQYRFAQHCLKIHRGDRAAAVEMFIDGVGAEKTPDGAPYSKSAVRAAMVGMSA